MAVSPSSIPRPDPRASAGTPRDPSLAPAGARTAASAGGPASVPPPRAKAEVRDFSFYYGEFQAVKRVNLVCPEHMVMALIGPSGCGKTTLLRCFNRMHDLYPGNRYEGEILLQPSGINIVERHINPIEMRMRISMVFQKPNPFPKSIFENVAYGLRLRGVRNKRDLGDRVEAALKGAALFDEVKDRMKKPAYALSGGQQQRLCIARALAVEPEIVLFDEPTSALDPIATGKIEELIHELKKRVTIVIVTHNMQQASRVSDYTAFMYIGEMIEVGPTSAIFQNPVKELTEQYISGRFG
jgi:phosphate transport system ATP-binding protein